jgi:ureidoglycolate lyase
MKTAKIEELGLKEFQSFGFYVNHINPITERIGGPPIEFFRDMVQLDLGSASIGSFSTCRVERRVFVIDVSEYHSSVGEGILPLDNDVIIHVGPATLPDSSVPIEEIRVFRVPKGTLVVLRPGVWHHAPFTVDDKPANVLIVLPERTYANDCHTTKLHGEDRIKIGV